MKYHKQRVEAIASAMWDAARTDLDHSTIETWAKITGDGKFADVVSMFRKLAHAAIVVYDMNRAARRGEVAPK